MTREQRAEDSTPKRYPTVAEVRAMLSEFPDDMPVASLAGEFGTYWPVRLDRARLRWSYKECTSGWGEAGYIWTEAWLGEEDNGTETEHVVI